MKYTGFLILKIIPVDSQLCFFTAMPVKPYTQSRRAGFMQIKSLSWDLHKTDFDFL